MQIWKTTREIGRSRGHIENEMLHIRTDTVNIIVGQHRDHWLSKSNRRNARVEPEIVRRACAIDRDAPVDDDRPLSFQCTVRE